MKNWKAVLRYADRVDIIMEMYLHGKTTKEQELEALKLVREWIRQEWMDREVDSIGYCLINGMVTEAENGTFRIIYSNIISAVRESLNNTEEFAEFIETVERYDKEHREIMGGWTEEAKREWADKFFSDK